MMIGLTTKKRKETSYNNITRTSGNDDTVSYSFLDHTSTQEEGIGRTLVD